MVLEDRYIFVPVPVSARTHWSATSPWELFSSTSGDAKSTASLPGQDRPIRVRYVTAGEGPAVLLVHGLGASLAVWLENILPLAEGHSIYALDLPGYGQSDKPNDIGHDAISGAHFLAGFQDYLGIKRATLVGNSAGGLATAYAACLPYAKVHILPGCGLWPELERPDLFNSLVLRPLQGTGDRQDAML